MSRAFVKETDGDETTPEQPRRKHSNLPNYITPAGAKVLRQRIETLAKRRAELAATAEDLGRKNELQLLDSDIEYFQERLRRAIVVQPPSRPWQTVEIGATVDLVDEHETRHRFTIVGEDEIDVAAGRISWSSPLGSAVMRRNVGDVVIWKRPVGDLELEIVHVSYIKEHLPARS